MERAALERLQEQFGQLVRERFPGAPIERVTILQYGDEPEIEPGQLLARVYIEAGEGQEAREQAMEDFHRAHRTAMRELRRELDRLPGVGPLEFMVSGEGEGEGGGDHGPRMRLGPRDGAPLAVEGPLVPVMARLGPTDLETVDVLITAGIAANRADAVRWALARIRERPAYAQLKERAREIEELKTQF
jgi:hypothetical protein